MARKKNAQAEQPDQRKSKRRGGGIISTLLIVVGVALLAVAGGMYAKNEYNYHQIDEVNERVAQYATLAADDGPPTVDWAALKAVNPDVVGWIQVPGTVVNYPVFQSGDNEFYLHHAPDKSYTLGGSVFLDYENKAPGLVDRQSIVYGHHMRNGSQFKQIADMDSQESFDGISRVWYVTEKGTYDLVPLFVFYTSDADLDVRQFSFETTKAYREYLKKYFAQAVTKRANAEEAIDAVEHVFTLSTCNYIDGYGRTLLVCAPRNEVPGTAEYDALADHRAKWQAELKKRHESEKKAWEAEDAQVQIYEDEFGNQYYDEYGEEPVDPELEEARKHREHSDQVPDAVPI